MPEVSQVVEQECGPTQTHHNLRRTKWGHASETVEVRNPLTKRMTFSATIVRRPNDGTATRDPRLANRHPITNREPRTQTTATIDPQLATTDPQLATTDPQLATIDPLPATVDQLTTRKRLDVYAKDVPRDKM